MVVPLSCLQTAGPALAAVVFAGSVAVAGFTSPTLVLSSARGEAAGGGRAAALEGSFDFPNAVQVGYPLHVVVFQGATFARCCRSRTWAASMRSRSCWPPAAAP